MKKKHRYVLVFIISGLVFCCLFCFLAISEQLKLQINSHLSFQEANAFYLHHNETKKLQQHLENNDSINLNKIMSTYGKKTKLNEIFHWNNITYLDLTLENSRVMIKYQAQIVEKYLLKNNFIQKNNNNQIEPIILKLDKISLSPTVSHDTIADPFSNSRYAFVSKNRELSYQSNEQINDQMYLVQVFNTAYIINESNTAGVIWEKNADMVQIALTNKVPLSLVVQWFGKERFDVNGCLNQQVFLCTQKQISFQVGRGVLFTCESDSSNNKMCHDFWDYGEAKMILKTDAYYYEENTCMDYSYIIRPELLSHCDEYYKNQALHYLFSEV